MLIIPEDILFKHATENMEVTESLFDHLMRGVPALIDLFGLITSADFNRFDNCMISESQWIPSPNIY